jgi:hypothetical protein
MGDGDRTWFATLLEAQGAAQTQVGKSKIKWEWKRPGESMGERYKRFQDLRRGRGGKDQSREIPISK